MHWTNTFEVLWSILEVLVLLVGLAPYLVPRRRFPSPELVSLEDPGVFSAEDALGNKLV